MRLVENFTVPAAMPVHAKPALAAAVNRQASVPQHVELAPAELEVQLPVSGKLYKFEKILVVKDQQWFSYRYKNLTK
jgi:hypothetical protein